MGSDNATDDATEGEGEPEVAAAKGDYSSSAAAAANAEKAAAVAAKEGEEGIGGRADVGGRAPSRRGCRRHPRRCHTALLLLSWPPRPLSPPLPLSLPPY